MTVVPSVLSRDIWNPESPDVVLNPSDPYCRSAQTFPVLTAEQLKRLMAYGRVEDAPVGHVLYKRGARNVDFFVILEGAADVLEVAADGTERPILTQHARQFSGELNLFNNRGRLFVRNSRKPGKCLESREKIFVGS